jgi:GH24 family phage-related lysozyme (muramidase)
MPVNNLKTSPDGLKKLELREAMIDGLYDDVSGYATFGVGHLVHPAGKWSSFLLACARGDNLCPANVKKISPGTAFEVVYLESAVTRADGFTGLKSKAQERAAGVIGEQAAEAVERECQLLSQAAGEVFAEDLRPYEKAVNESVTTVLTQNQFDALVSFTFNVGIGALKSSTLLKKVNAAPRNPKEIEAAFLVWNKSGGKVVAGLTRRRQAEANQFLGVTSK